MDMTLASSSLWNSLSTISGSIFSGSIMWKWVVFDNTNYAYDFSTIPLWKTFSLSGRTITHVPWKVFAQSSNNSGSTLLPGISASIIFDYDKNNAQNWGIKRLLSFGLVNIDTGPDAGDFLKSIDSSFVRFQWNSLHEHITAYNDGIITATGIYWMNGCGNNNGNLSWADSCYPAFNKSQSNTIAGKNIIAVNVSFNTKKYCIYLNGMKFICEDIDQSVIDRLQEWWYKSGSFRISAISEFFSGIIDDVKIYNRALSESEIKQQAKAAGF
jgi:hypothetical protein